MSEVTYTEVGSRDEFPDYADRDAGFVAEDASGQTRVITIEEKSGTTLGDALRQFIQRDIDGLTYWPAQARTLMTTEGWWSGYSEYTVTNTWETVVVSCPELNWERRWDSPALLFADLAATLTPSEPTP